MQIKKEIKLSSSFYTKYATIYSDSGVTPKACILYFHGGGLIYGCRNDLPDMHIRTLTQAGYAVIALDYPLAPAAKLNTILDDVCSSIADYVKQPELFAMTALPFFLMGRSAGAYLCLLAAAHGELISPPKGVISYYGYGFLCGSWFQTPNDYYKSLPAVDPSCLQSISDEYEASAQLDTHYSIYVYARQTGSWSTLFYEGREKYFYLDYTLRTCDSLPCPLFCAHSMNDTDVPYAEFLELSSRFKAEKFIVADNAHDFDRDTSSASTQKLLDETVEFLDKIGI